MLQFLKVFSAHAYSTSKKSKLKNNLISLPLIAPSISTSLSHDVFGGNFQTVMNFLNRVSSVLEIEIPRPEIIENTKNNHHPKYEVIAHNVIALSDKHTILFKSDIQSFNRLTFSARAKSISDAKRLALQNLAESLFTILRSAQLFLPVSDQDPKKVLPHVSFDLTKSQLLNLNSAIDVCRTALESVPIDECSRRISHKLYDNANELKNENYPEKVQFLKPQPLSGRLPIYKHYSDIVQSLEENQVTIVSATTGSGKTTQIPKIIMHHFQSFSPKIIVTQPRRVAAISLATRLAHELGEPSVGHSVGYSVRFDSVFPAKKDSNILFCTSGLLIKKLQYSNDESIQRCTHIILDEIHERDINTDILLLTLRRLLAQRKDIKVLIMSATLDSKKFYDYFNENGLLNVGKPINIETDTNYPVSTSHLEEVLDLLKQPKTFPKHLCIASRQCIEDEINGRDVSPDIIPYELVSSLVKHLHETRPDGSILCFLPGWEEITEVKKGIELQLNDSNKPFRIYCVHSSSPPETAQAIFRNTQGERKIILATNIAESSITIPDVVYIIDSGKQKVNTYNISLRMNSLKTDWISRSNCLQRRGRVGRTQPGEYFLLCSKNRILSPNTQPEILRVGLEDVCLSIKGLGFEGKCQSIMAELLDKPDKTSIRSAVNLLINLDALEPETENITSLGKILAGIPLNPTLGKSLVLSHVLGLSKNMLSVAAGVGERVLRMPKKDDMKDEFLRLVRRIRSNYLDDHEVLVDFSEKFDDHELSSIIDSRAIGYVSTLSLKRISNLKQSLKTQLEKSFPSNNDLSLPEDVCRKIDKIFILGGFYPDIACRMSKRNQYLLTGGVCAEPQKESMQYSESLETMIREYSFENNMNHGSRISNSPVLVFEELFDAGHSMIVKSSVVDPITCVLFAENFKISNNVIFIDNWIRISSQDHESLEVLAELRAVWKKLSKAIITYPQNDLVNKAKKLLVEIANIMDFERGIDLK